MFHATRLARPKKRPALAGAFNIRSSTDRLPTGGDRYRAFAASFTDSGEVAFANLCSALDSSTPRAVGTSIHRTSERKCWSPYRWNTMRLSNPKALF